MSSASGKHWTLDLPSAASATERCSPSRSSPTGPADSTAHSSDTITRRAARLSSTCTTTFAPISTSRSGIEVCQSPFAAFSTTTILVSGGIAIARGRAEHVHHQSLIIQHDGGDHSPNRRRWDHDTSWNTRATKPGDRFQHDPVDLQIASGGQVATNTHIAPGRQVVHRDGIERPIHRFRILHQPEVQPSPSIRQLEREDSCPAVPRRDATVEVGRTQDPALDVLVQHIHENDRPHPAASGAVRGDEGRAQIEIENEVNGLVRAEQKLLRETDLDVPWPARSIRAPSRTSPESRTMTGSRTVRRIES